MGTAHPGKKTIPIQGKKSSVSPPLLVRFTFFPVKKAPSDGSRAAMKIGFGMTASDSAEFDEARLLEDLQRLRM